TAAGSRTAWSARRCARPASGSPVARSDPTGSREAAGGSHAPVHVPLPAGFTVGHATDTARGTGCTVVLAPPGTTAAGEVRGGGPGTRESDLLSPASGAREVQAVVFCGGSAYGLAAADGVARWLAGRERGYRTYLGVLVPLVPAAVVFDLEIGDPDARPGPEEGAAACEAAGTDVARGTVGAG